jgi:hypothetical protein
LVLFVFLVVFVRLVEILRERPLSNNLGSNL